MTAAAADPTGIPRRPTVHILNDFGHAAGGSEQRAFALARALAGHAEVRLWATRPPGADVAAAAPLPVRLIRPWPGCFPCFGTFVLVGVYWHGEFGRWRHAARPSRKIVVYNTSDPAFFADLERRLGDCRGSAPVEVVHVHPGGTAELGRPGVLEPSAIDLDRFRPMPRPRGDFTVGRMSRDVKLKFHPQDPALFAGLAGEGMRLRLMGATCLPALAGVPGIAVLPTGAEPPEKFLGSLDCFFYRTDPAWFETFGRVVFEAMACGLPVACGRTGGYAGWIEHGRNGFLFDDADDDAARAILRDLRGDPALCARIGAAARATLERLYQGHAQRLRDFYLAPGPVAA
jgi:glycosyltransferase involved in cell wall biosynthesis